MSGLSSSIDLHRVLAVQVGISTVAAAAIAPSYNLPIFLYGWYTMDNDASVEGVRQFLTLVVASFLLDVVWLYSWGSQTSSFPYFLVLANFFLKPVTLLAGLGNLRQRGASTFGDGFVGLPGGGGGPVWSMPGSFGAGAGVPSGPSPVSHQANLGNYQAFDADAQSVQDYEASLGQRIQQSRTQGGNDVSPALPGGGRTEEGYHSLP